jgi:hypothetical protein
MTAKTEHRQLKRVADILSAVFISYMIILPFWCHYDPTFSRHVPPGGNWPIQAKIFFMDAIPFGCGIVWLTYRYGNTLARNYPFIRTTWFRVLFILSGPAIVIIMQIIWGVKN